MTKVIGVRFRTAGKVYYFDPLTLAIKKGDHVIVETARGIEFGTVVAGVMEVADEKVVQPLKSVIRIANQRDVEQEAANREKEKEAFRICLEKIRDHGLEMKLIDAEYTFDNNKVLFYFTADGRIDFRELVKDLAGVFKTRIELRQIGVRDETKIVGGIGICGRPLCCHSYLADFVPVSIKMAKEQNLSLNPAKISGMCGRLMCCLKNEEETYEELNKRLPNIGDSVTTLDGLRGEVHSVNVLRQLVKVVVSVGDEKEIKEYPVEKLQFRRRHSKKEKMNLSREELEELERLEEEERIREQLEAEERAEEEHSQESAGRQKGGQRQNSSRGSGNQKHSGQNAEGGRSQRGEGGWKQSQRGEESQKKQFQRGEESQKQQFQRDEERQKPRGAAGQRQSEQRGEGSRKQSQRGEESQKQQSQRGEESQKPRGAAGQRQSEQRGEGGRKQSQRGEENQRQRGEGNRRHGGRRRQDNRRRQNEQQEGQAATDGSQTERE